jgi:hypothetical protein
VTARQKFYGINNMPAPSAESNNTNGQQCNFFKELHIVLDLTQVTKNNEGKSRKGANRS